VQYRYNFELGFAVAVDGAHAASEHAAVPAGNHVGLRVALVQVQPETHKVDPELRACMRSVARHGSPRT
jgi:hypothetical protein